MHARREVGAAGPLANNDMHHVEAHLSWNRFVHAMLSNALAATVLAVLVAILGRACRRPAFIHGLWLVVMLKLVTPPVVPVSLPGGMKVIAIAWPASGPAKPQEQLAVLTMTGIDVAKALLETTADCATFDRAVGREQRHATASTAE